MDSVNMYIENQSGHVTIANKNIINTDGDQSINSDIEIYKSEIDQLKRMLDFVIKNTKNCPNGSRIIGCSKNIDCKICWMKAAKKATKYSDISS